MKKSFRINIISNYFGQGWALVMGISFIPTYVKYLGVEAYGLIGVYSLLQASLSLLDLGLTPALSREMSRFTGGAISVCSIRNLLRSIEYVAAVIMVLIVLAVWFFSDWLAINWVKSEVLTVKTISQSFTIMGIVIALRFFEGLYRSSLIGLQRQVLFNIVISILATLRWVGALALLVWISPTIEAFFLWQALVSGLTLVVLAYFTYNTIPKTQEVTIFSVVALKEIWIFARGMLGITALTIVLAQADKIILSKMLLLTDYGYYTLAATIAGGLTMLVSPIAQAYYPKATELYSRNAIDELVEFYHKSAQLVSVIMGSVGMIFVFFSEEIMLMWTDNMEIVDQSAEILSLLSVGNILNGFMWIPYQTQLAYGWTSLSVRLNMAALLFVIPSLIFITPKYGAEGAAVVWVFLNLGYVLIGIHFMYSRIMKEEKLEWYLSDLLIPILVSCIVTYSMSIVIDGFHNVISKVFLMSLTLVMSLLSTLAVTSILKKSNFKC